ncbi:MAG: cytidylate kinase-like family protein [Spirochaetes bacterium]|jgi:cytidylate kinase|nr:cytidylate kinase-like family protein [Spirochaetota bacterium]
MSSYIKGSTLEKSIQKQLKLWENQKVKLVEKQEPRPFITISREYGCNAVAIADALAEALNKYESTDVWKSYDKELIDKICSDHNIAEALCETIDTKRREEISEFWRSVLTDYPPQVSVYQKLVQTIRSLSIHGRSIIVGRAGVMITRSLRYGVHIKLVAPAAYRIQKVMETAGIKDRLEAEKLVERKDRERHDFMTQYLKFDAKNPSSYDVTFNVARITPGEIAQSVICILKSKQFIK